MTGPIPQILDGETWRSVVGHDGEYEVSTRGRVRSLDRVVSKHRGKTEYRYHVHGRVLSARVERGYGYVALRSRNTLVHRIVAHAFLGEQPSGTVVCHRNGDRSNNAPENLRYDTPAGNSADMALHGTLLLGTKNHMAKLDGDSVRFIRSMRGRMTQRELGERFGVTKQAIGYVQRGAVWRHLHG